MMPGQHDQDSKQDATLSETKVCINCNESRPVSNYRPSSYRLKDGTRKTKRRKICRRCERDSRKDTCNSCTRPVKPGHTCCEHCLKIIRESAAQRRLADKKAFFDHYGWACNYCGESKEFFLTLDHKNNDGAKDRKKSSYRQGAGHHGYRKARLENYPPKYQTLCYNCNCVKHTLGEETLKQLLNISHVPNPATKE